MNELYYFVGEDVRDGETMVFPRENCIILTDMRLWKEKIREKLEEAQKEAQDFSTQTHLPLPAGLCEALGVEAPELPDEIKNRIGKQHGTRLELLVSQMQAEVVLIWNGERFPMRNVHLVPLQKVLQDTGMGF